MFFSFKWNADKICKQQKYDVLCLYVALHIYNAYCLCQKPVKIKRAETHGCHLN